jgi:hypothetical protein
VALQRLLKRALRRARQQWLKALPQRQQLKPRQQRLKQLPQ